MLWCTSIFTAVGLRGVSRCGIPTRRLFERGAGQSSLLPTSGDFPNLGLSLKSFVHGCCLTTVGCSTILGFATLFACLLTTVSCSQSLGVSSRSRSLRLVSWLPTLSCWSWWLSSSMILFRSSSDTLTVVLLDIEFTAVEKPAGLKCKIDNTVQRCQPVKCALLDYFQ